ncbi:MAG TPA: DUF6728 family protein [Flavobacteriales bacterium]
MIKKILYYLNPLNLFKKEEGTSYTRAMHTMNKITFLMVLVIVLILVIRWLR